MVELGDLHETETGLRALGRTLVYDGIIPATFEQDGEYGSGDASPRDDDFCGLGRHCEGGCAERSVLSRK